eukprot:2762654-Rhodomonas_salina.1
MALFRYTNTHDFNEEADYETVWGPGQREFRQEWLERHKLSKYERGPRAYPATAGIIQYDTVPLYAADKVWRLNHQEYIGPITGPHTESAFSAIYGMDFTTLFHTTRMLRA